MEQTIGDELVFFLLVPTSHEIHSPEGVLGEQLYSPKGVCELKCKLRMNPASENANQFIISKKSTFPVTAGSCEKSKCRRYFKNGMGEQYKLRTDELLRIGYYLDRKELIPCLSKHHISFGVLITSLKMGAD